MTACGRERQPWEAADGAIYLVRELAGAAPDTMTSLMPLLAEAVRAEHYAHACHLQVGLVGVEACTSRWRRLRCRMAQLPRFSSCKHLTVIGFRLLQCTRVQHFVRPLSNRQ